MPDRSVSELLNELALIAINERATRNDVVPVYADLIVNEQRGQSVPWAEVNRTIIHKWSEAGLSYIKREAWTWAAGDVGYRAASDEAAALPDRLTDIRARLEWATRGHPEWYEDAMGSPTVVYADAGGRPVADVRDDADRDFIAHAPADIAWLIAQHEWMNAERDQVIDWLSARAGNDVPVAEVLFLFGLIQGRTSSGQEWSGTCWCKATTLAACTCKDVVMDDEEDTGDNNGSA